MRILRYERAEGADRGAAIAIGNFDGLHPGHQAVIMAAGDVARVRRLPHAVLTFEPHPYAVFNPAAAPFRLTPFRSKARHIEALGVDLLLALHFNREFAKRTAEQFIDEILVGGLGASHVAVGYDFVFGNQRRGTAKFLVEAARTRGFGVTIVERAATSGGEVYSSTRIREHLVGARPREAAKLLGRWWEIDGRVEHAAGVGKDLGYPTANLPMTGYLQPAPGIYAAFAGIEVGKRADWHPAAVYFGRRPTLGGQALGLEVYLIDFAGDLYGRHLRVALVDYLRPDAAFAGLGALKAQIADDVARTRRVLAGEKPEP
ncbi:MAG: bifunctional riboflavin kinase/FAD synthetase [Gemmataceae bacterium]